MIGSCRVSTAVGGREELFVVFPKGEGEDEEEEQNAKEGGSVEDSGAEEGGSAEEMCDSEE